VLACLGDIFVSRHRLERQRDEPVNSAFDGFRSNELMLTYLYFWLLVAIPTW
jgi:hypothetical protein